MHHRRVVEAAVRSVRPVPAGLPLLRRGRHRRLEDGSCLMEYVSVLAGERFTDRPRCTARVLAHLSRLVNDRIRDEFVTFRSADQVRAAALLPLAPALVHTSPDRVVRPVVLEHLAATGLAVAPHDRLLRRLRRRAQAYRAGGGGPLHRVWLRSAMAAGTTVAFGKVDRLLRALEPSRRNARWIALLAVVVADLPGATSSPPQAPITVAG